MMAPEEGEGSITYAPTNEPTNEKSVSPKASIIEYEAEIEEYGSEENSIERTNSQVIDHFMAEEERKEVNQTF